MENRNKLIEQAYVEHYDVLYKAAYARLKNVMDAEDAVQEAFSYALKYYHTYNPAKAGVGAWTRRILTNVCNTIQRDEKNKGMSMEFKEELNEGIEMTHLGDQLLEKMKGHIAEKRNANTRAVLSLHFISGAKPREIAAIVPLRARYISILIKDFRKEVVGMYA